MMRRRPLIDRKGRQAHGVLLLLALVALAVIAATSTAQVAVPGGPDAPPPTPAAPTRTPTPTRAPSGSSSGSSSDTAGPSAAELRAQQLADQKAAEEKAAAKAAAAKAAAAKRERERQAALLRQRRERASEFRDLAAFTTARNTVQREAADASETLIRAAEGSQLVALAPDAASPGQGGGHGTALLFLLLAASGVSAGLAFLPRGLARRRAVDDERVAPSRILAAVEARAVFAERHRVELAGVASACLLVALLIAVGLV